MVEVIAFDGDDTLWHSESYFVLTQERFAELLAPYVEAERVAQGLLATERRNLDVFGYGVKGFTLSMIETAVAVTDGRVSVDEITTILGWGREMMRHPVELLEGVAETLEQLSRDHRLALVTKGDLFHQESKLAASGLGEIFEHVAIVTEKDPATYRRVVSTLGVEPASFLMVGNSPRSDIAPVLEIGGRAVHIPYHLTWALERAVLPPAHDPATDVWLLDDIRELPALLTDLT
ncbi:MAG: HAD family hydrolase [Actinobacteria bacterium]|nr:HAD family hydrolase [Actinomycetota bacterium]